MTTSTANDFVLSFPETATEFEEAFVHILSARDRGHASLVGVGRPANIQNTGTLRLEAKLRGRNDADGFEGEWEEIGALIVPKDITPSAQAPSNFGGSLAIGGYDLVQVHYTLTKPTPSDTITGSVIVTSTLHLGL